MENFKEKTQGTLQYLETTIRNYKQNKITDEEFVKTLNAIYITFKSNLERG